MASAVRIERCPDKLTAEARKVALIGQNYTVQIVTGTAVVDSSDAVVVGTKTTLDDKLLWGAAPFIVFAVK